jgi:LysR family transcriptional regulator, cell division regulator
VRDGEVVTLRPPQRVEMVDTVFVRRADAYFSSAMSAFLQTARPSPPPPAPAPEADKLQRRSKPSLPAMTPI